MNNFRKILFQEIDSFVNNLDISKKKILTEIFDFNSDSIFRKYDSSAVDISGNTSIDEEMWHWFLQTIEEAFQENQYDWLKYLKEQKLRILCYKYFTKKELLKTTSLEKEVRKEIGKFVASLQTFSDYEEFLNRISNLPLVIQINLVRFIFLKNKNLDNKIKISRDEFKERIVKLKTERIEFAEKIAMISKKYQNILDLEKLKELYDNGLFFEDNMLNRGINEYIYKLLTYNLTFKTIKEKLSGSVVNDIKTLAEQSPAYLNHISEIRKDTTQQFFTEKGLQIGIRFQSEIESIKNKDEQNNNTITDPDSVFKEPKGKIRTTRYSNKQKNSNSDDSLDNTDIQRTDNGNVGAHENKFSTSEFGSTSDFTVDNNINFRASDETNKQTPLETDEQGFPVDFGSEEEISNEEDIKK